MKHFEKRAAQGEITITRISGSVPQGAQKLALENGQLIIGHSETGHHHIIADPALAEVHVINDAPEGMRILHMIVSGETSLDHLREFDAHESIALAPGGYEIRIGREYDPYQEIARRQAD